MTTTQKPMSPVAFVVMSLIMYLKKRKRNIEQEIALAKPVRGSTILDFGCGLGFNAIPAAKLVGMEGNVFALDVSKQAVNLVNKKAKKAKIGNITTIHSDCDTALEDESVDVVYLHNVFPLIHNKKPVLKEILRVLRKGGRLSVTTGKMARRAGQNTMSDEDLVKHLLNEYHCKLVNNVDGHFIFKK